MRSNAELRKEARDAVRGRWLWRILLVAFALQAIGQMAMQALARFNQERGIISAGELLMKKISALQQGLDYALPTRDAYAQMWVASGFEYFVGTLAGAIMMFGLTAVTLRALENREEGWLASGFGGFHRPLGVTALLFVQNVIVCFWLLLLVVPGVVAAYRYRAVWYLKCENPDWGVLRCLGESARMMKGYKGRAFRFDLYYWGAIFGIALFACVGAAVMSFDNAVASAIGMLVIASAMVAGFYVMVLFVAGRTAFYRELKSVRKVEARNDLPGND